MSEHRALELGDILDGRAYERGREEFRDRVIEAKKLRRVGVGPVVTLLFENRLTILFQIQEMARAERMLSDAAIQAELDTYNPLIPGRGELTATLFIELTDKDQMTNWLPKLVGIERSVEIVMGEGEAAESVRCVVDDAHAAQLTRGAITASVHYIRFEFTAAQSERFVNGPVSVAIDHPNYRESTTLGAETRSSLADDLLGR